jgi:hypothetical protein
MSKFQVIHAKLAWQSIAYFCHRIDWFEWNSAETSTTWASSKPFSAFSDSAFFSDRFAGLQGLQVFAGKLRILQGLCS